MKNLRFTALVLSVILLNVCASAKTYVLCVGIGKYASPQILELNKTENDAKDVSKFYAHATDKVYTILGKSATKRNILKKMSDIIASAGSNDKFVFYFSGHGYKGGLCPYDMTDTSGGLTYREIIEAMNRSKAREKYILVDACNCGALRAEDNVLFNRNGSFIMFLSSRGSENSRETLFEQNGIFTKYLLKGLGGAADANQDRTVTAKEIYDYVSRGVKSQTGNKQNPVMWGKFDNNHPIVQYHRK